MKTAFPGYFRPTEPEFKALWENAVFVLDANVLLNIYRYSPPTRLRILDLVESIRDRIWIPHNFAEEFIRNRSVVIYDQAQSYRDAHRELKNLLDQRLKAPHRHPFVPQPSIRALEKVCDQLKKSEQVHMRLLTEDPFYDRLAQALTGRIGPASSASELVAIYTEARNRYAAKIPPGFLDAKKAEPNAFGDFVGWRQILDYGSKNATSLILVTDDKKEDWWHAEHERQLGPRPELVSEYLHACKQPFYMYTLVNFLKFSQIRLGKRVGSTAINEVRAQSNVRLIGEGTVVKALAPPFSESPKESADSTLNEDEQKREEPNPKPSPEKPTFN